MARTKQIRRKNQLCVKPNRPLKVACKRTFYQYKVGPKDISYLQYSKFTGSANTCDLPLETLHTVGVDDRGKLHYKCKLLRLETYPVWLPYNGEPRVTSLIEAFRTVSVQLFGNRAADFWRQAETRRLSTSSSPCSSSKQDVEADVLQIPLTSSQLKLVKRHSTYRSVEALTSENIVYGEKCTDYIRQKGSFEALTLALQDQFWDEACAETEHISDTEAESES